MRSANRVTNCSASANNSDGIEQSPGTIDAWDSARRAATRRLRHASNTANPDSIPATVETGCDTVSVLDSVDGAWPASRARR